MSHPSPASPEILKLNLGDTHTIALKFTEGKPVRSNYSGDQLMYTLLDGRRLYVDPYVGERIRDLRLAPNEQFEILKLERWVGNKRTLEVDVRRSEKRASAVAQTPARGVTEVVQSSQTPQHTPAPPPLPMVPVNGQGETAADIMSRCYRDAIDIAISLMHYARENGLMISPTYEDIRTSGTALFIQSSGGRR